MKKIIEMDQWPRKDHFNFYQGLDYPHFNICAEVDITAVYHFTKKNRLSIHQTLIYLVLRAANETAPFRLRIRADQVIEHDVIHVAPTVLGEQDLFGFCLIQYKKNFQAFLTHAGIVLKEAAGNISLKEDKRDDVIYLSSLPWIYFTSISHPIHIHPADSIPRISWGKFKRENNSIKMPLSVQVNHSLMDGIHVGRYYQLVESFFEQPGKILTLNPEENK